MATELQETELIARMEDGDLVAIDVKYHLQYKKSPLIIGTPA